MRVACFLDTNVLLYAAMTTRRNDPRTPIARHLVGTVEFGTSVQVLQEFFVNTVGKPHLAMSPARALDWIEKLAELPCVGTDTGLVFRGIELSQRFRISYWDGAIVAAAEQLGAETLYTEDLNHGQVYGSVRACNPFVTA